MQQMPAHVGFQRIQRFRFQYRVHILKELRIPHVDFTELRRIHTLKEALEMEVRCQRNRIGS